MTMDPNEKDAMMNAHDAAAKPQFAVQVLGSSAVISVPLAAYSRMQSFARRNGASPTFRRVTVSGKILKEDGSAAATFEDTVETPDPGYVKTIPLPLGTYRLELIVKDMASGNVVRDSGEFRVR